MDYSYEEFASLAAEVELQGGGHLPDECVPTVIHYPKPGSSNLDEVNTCHCGNQAIFVSVYEPGDEEARLRGAGFVRSCSVCDSMGAWPRYESALGVG